MAVRSRDTNPDIPRDPGAYSPDEHAIIKKKKRDIPGWVIRHLIENGKIRDKGEGRYVFYDTLKSGHPDHGIQENEWVLPVQINEGTNIVTTCPHILGVYDDDMHNKSHIYKP